MIDKKYGMSQTQIYRYGFKLCMEVYDKFNRVCANCGSCDYLAIHHLDGKGRNYEEKGLELNNNLDNLQLLCRSCHGRIHGGAMWRFGSDTCKRRGREKEYAKEYRQKNIDKLKEKSRMYYLENKHRWSNGIYIKVKEEK